VEFDIFNTILTKEPKVRKVLLGLFNFVLTICLLNCSNPSSTASNKYSEPTFSNPAWKEIAITPTDSISNYGADPLNLKLGGDGNAYLKTWDMLIRLRPNGTTENIITKIGLFCGFAYDDGDFAVTKDSIFIITAWSNSWEQKKSGLSGISIVKSDVKLFLETRGVQGGSWAKKEIYHDTLTDASDEDVKIAIYDKNIIVTFFTDSLTLLTSDDYGNSWTNKTYDKYMDPNYCANIKSFSGGFFFNKENAINVLRPGQNSKLFDTKGSLASIALEISPEKIFFGSIAYENRSSGVHILDLATGTVDSLNEHFPILTVRDFSSKEIITKRYAAVNCAIANDSLIIIGTESYTGGKGLIVSTDQGSTWASQGLGPDGEVYDIIQDSEGYIYLITDKPYISATPNPF
jgi:photosystem II stability/assembly factor-like uncharacterized protein